MVLQHKCNVFLFIILLNTVLLVNVILYVYIYIYILYYVTLLTRHPTNTPYHVKVGKYWCQNKLE